MKHFLFALLYALLTQCYPAFSMKNAARAEASTAESNIIQNTLIAIPESAEKLVSWYDQLAEEQKQALRQEIEASAQTKSHPLMNHKNMAWLSTYARQILERYRQSRIFCLGQSLTYLIEACRIRQVLENNSSASIKHIAFSGHFFTSNERPTLSYTKNPESDCPSKNQIKRFRVYLASIGFSPRAIIKEHARSKEKTIIVEYVQKGEGLASFLRILEEWAKKENLLDKLHNCLTLHLLSYIHYSPRPKNFRYTGALLPVNYQLFFSLVNNDSSDDRLVMKFKYFQWDTSDDPEKHPHNFRPARNAQLIRFHIIDYLINKAYTEEPND